MAEIRSPRSSPLRTCPTRPPRGRAWRRAQPCSSGWWLSLFLLLCGHAAFTPWLAGSQRPDSIAVDRPWHIESYGEAAGITNHRAYELAFEDDGDVWIAAANGLYRYDGYRWSVFRAEDGLPSTNIRSLKRSKSGELWVGTDKGAGVFDPIKRRFDRRGSDTGLPNQNIRRIEEDPDGTLWFCCDQWPDPSVAPGGLAGYKDGKWRRFDRTSGIPMNYVISYFRSSGGRQFTGTRHGWVERVSDDRWASPREPGADLDDQIFTFVEQPDGTLWAQGVEKLLRNASGAWSAVDASTAAITTLRDGRLMAIRRDVLKGRLCFAEWNGKDFIPASAWVDYPSGSRIYSIKEAPDGALWTVGTGIILRWSPHTHNWTVHPNISRVLGMDTTGKVWFASDDRLYSLDRGRLTAAPDCRSYFASAADGTIVAERSSDHSWVTMTPGKPASIADIDCGITTFLKSVQENNGRLWVLGFDRAGHLAAAHRTSTGWVRVPAPPLSRCELSSVSAAHDGGLWILLVPMQGLEYNLHHVSINGIQPADLGPDRPACVAPVFTETSEHFWIQGSAAVHQKARVPGAPWKKIVVHETSSSMLALPTSSSPQDTQGIPPVEVSRLVLLPDEVLFCFTGGRGGLSGFALYHDNRWRVHADNFTGIYGARDRRSVFFGTRGGVFVRKQPGSTELQFIPLPEDVYVRTIHAEDDRAFWVTTSNGVFSYRSSSEPPATAVSIAVNEVQTGSSLPVRFSGIRRFDANAAPRSFSYSWRFDNGTWSPYLNLSEVRLPLGGLAPGRHTLEVRSREQAGLSDPSSAKASFVVLPQPLQHRSWFLPALTFLASTLLYLTWLGIARTREISRANATLRDEIRERKKAENALREAHDQLELRVVQRTAELSRANDALRREITEREKAVEIQNKLEDQLRDARKLEALGTLAGGIAHDFNNILTVIIPSAHLALDDCPQGSTSRELLEQIISSANHARDLVQQILAFSRQQRKQLHPVDLAPIVAEVGRLLAASLPSTMRAACDISANLPQVRADGTQIQRLLMNLCTNARQAMMDRVGTIELRAELVHAGLDEVKRCPGLRRGDYVRLSVRDEGVGMTPEIIQRAFDPFFTTKSPGEGTGLGLSVVHGIVKEHGGTIHIDSAPGRGALFEVYLPAIPKTAQAPGPHTEGTPPADRGDRTIVSGRGKRLLLVDDDAVVSQVVARILTRADYRVTLHSDAKSALETFRQDPSRFEAVITDFAMPGMNGVELSRELSSLRPELPIILITGYAGACPPEEIAAAGVRRVVGKPFNPAAFSQILAELVPEPPGGAEPRA